MLRLSPWASGVGQLKQIRAFGEGTRRAVAKGVVSKLGCCCPDAHLSVFCTNREVPRRVPRIC